MVRPLRAEVDEGFWQWLGTPPGLFHLARSAATCDRETKRTSNHVAEPVFMRQTYIVIIGTHGCRAGFGP